MGKNSGIILVVVLGAMVAGMLSLSVSGLLFYNLAIRGERGSGVIVSEQRDVGEFDEVSICCGMHLLLEQSDSRSVQVEGDDNLLARVKISIRGDTLVIEYERGLRNIRPSQTIRAHVATPSIRAAITSGGSEMTASDLSSDSFDLSVSGGGRAEIDALDVDEFDLSLSGGGNVSIAGGQADSQSLQLSGGGTYDGANLRSALAELSISGGGDATIWVTEELDVNASGGSQVYFYGRPRITQSSSGGSRIESLGDR